MTSHQQDWLDVLDSVSPARATRSETSDQPPWSVRVRARLFASRYDREIEAGVIPVAGSPLAVHWMRLTSVREREDLASALRTIAGDAGSDRQGIGSRVPVQRVAIVKALSAIDEVRAQLTDPGPVRARGMARLRILLADGRGPVYRAGRGTLTAAMCGVSAAL
jgi:hypothetical protein